MLPHSDPGRRYRRAMLRVTFLNVGGTPRRSSLHIDATARTSSRGDLSKRGDVLHRRAILEMHLEKGVPCTKYRPTPLKGQRLWFDSTTGRTTCRPGVARADEIASKL